MIAIWNKEFHSIEELLIFFLFYLSFCNRNISTPSSLCTLRYTHFFLPPPRFHMLQVLCMLAYNLIIVIMLVMIVTIMKGSETHRIALTNHFHSLPHLIFKAPRGFNICSISHSRTKSKPNMAFSENLAFLIPWTK